MSQSVFRDDDRISRWSKRLIEWNRRHWTPGTGVLAMLLALIFASGTFLGHIWWKHGLNVPPPIASDGPDYDSLGWELSRGRGFAIDLSEPEFRRAYRELSTESDPPLPDDVRHGLTGYRQPLFPFALAVGNRLFGRQFWFGRAINCLAMSAACFAVAAYVFRAAGPVPVLIAVTNFVLIDPRSRMASRELLTEAFAVLGVAALLPLLIAVRRQPKATNAILVGLIAGLASLNRSMFLLWIPVLLWMIYASGRLQAESQARSLSRAVLAGAAAIAVCLPWFVRNCAVTGSFMPLGTQGGMELPAGYSDEAFARGGVWFSQSKAGFFIGATTTEVSGLEKEIAWARFGQAHVRRWIISHPHKLIPLAAMKVFHEFRPHQAGVLYVLAFAALGLIALRGTDLGYALTGLFAAAAFSIALTWSVSGRFVVPLLPVLHIAAAVGLWWGFVAVTAGCNALGPLIVRGDVDRSACREGAGAVDSATP